MLFVTKEFLTSELRDALLPVILKLFKQEPESHPFRYPVDADRLNIPVSNLLVCK